MSSSRDARFELLAVSEEAKTWLASSTQQKIEKIPRATQQKSISASVEIDLFTWKREKRMDR